MTTAGHNVSRGTRRWSALWPTLALAALLGIMSLPLICWLSKGDLGLAGTIAIAELLVLGLFGAFVGFRPWPLWWPGDALLAGWCAVCRGLGRQDDEPLPRRVRWLVAGLTLLGAALAADFIFSGQPLLLGQWLQAAVEANEPLPRLWVALGTLRAVQVVMLLVVVPRLCFRSPQAWTLTLVLAVVTVVLSAVTMAAAPLRAAAELWPGEFFTPRGFGKWALAPAAAVATLVILAQDRHCFFGGGWDGLPPPTLPAADAALLRRRLWATGVSLLLIAALGCCHLTAREWRLSDELAARHWWRVRVIARFNPAELRTEKLYDPILLATAAEAGDLEQVEVLLPLYLKYFPDPGAVGGAMAAAGRAKTDTVFDYLLSRNLDRLGDGFAGFCALGDAVMQRRHDWFARLRARGNPLQPPKAYRWPNILVFSAAEAGEVEMLKYLQTNGLTLASFPSGTTPLHYAARGGDLATMKYLVGAGLDPLAVNTYGSTVLHWYAYRPSDSARPENKPARAEVVDYLLSLGLDRNAKDKDGKTAWDLAAPDRGRAGLRAILEARGATVTPPPPPAAPCGLPANWLDRIPAKRQTPAAAGPATPATPSPERP